MFLLEARYVVSGHTKKPHMLEFETQHIVYIVGRLFLIPPNPFKLMRYF